MASIKDDIDLVSRSSGLGELSNAAANSLLGFNHRATGNPIPRNTDNQGLTFFTRPRLNLSYDNIAMDRVLTPLLRSDGNEKAKSGFHGTDPGAATYQRAVRALLDPVGAFARNVTSPLIDNESPFIALLTNNLLSLNGWPDPVVEYYNSKEGVSKEVWTMIDDRARYYGAFDLQGSFRNIAGDPITLLFNVWIRYAAQVYLGRLMPYIDSLIENEIDYQTRIYRLILDPSRRYVQKIAAANAGFPTTSALGAAFNFTSDQPFNQEVAEQISIPFHCVGVEYNDPILVEEFNFLVGLFKSGMREDRRGSSMVEIPHKELNLFNYYGYPHIESTTMKLTWWIDASLYSRLKNQQFTYDYSRPGS